MSDIFIQGETLQIGKKVDYVEIQGVNETVESLSPKIVVSGGNVDQKNIVSAYVVDDNPLIASEFNAEAYIEKAEVI